MEPLTPFSSTFVPLRDGEECHILVAGSGPPILFVHGLPGLGADFLPLARQLTGRRKCLLIDRAGYGRSPLKHRHRPIGIEQNVTDLLDIMNKLKIGQAHLAAWSYAGHIALSAAAYAPQRFDRLVFLGAAGPTLPWPRTLTDRILFQSRVGGPLLRTVRRLAPSVLKQALDDAYGRRAPDNVFQNFLRHIDQPQALRQWLREGAVWTPSTAPAGDVPHPSLVIHGDRDTRVPLAVGQVLAGRLPNGHLMVVEGAGHWPFATHTDQVCAQIADFLAPI